MESPQTTVSRRGLLIGAGTASAGVVTWAGAGPAGQSVPAAATPAGSAAPVPVRVEYGVDAGATDHVASGFLHGIDPADPAQYLVDGIAVRAIRGADHHPNLPSLFDRATYDRVSATGAELQVGVYYYSSDPDDPDREYRPGDDGDLETWERIVTRVWREAADAGYRVGSWIPWNEPDLQWSSEERPFAGFLEAFRVAHRTLRDLDPAALVQGPELAAFDLDRLTRFLSYCQEQDCLPDVLAWHELVGATPAQVTDHVAQIRQWMVEQDIPPMPVSITEYQGTGYGNPDAWHVGRNVSWLAQFERARADGLESALYSAWEWVGEDPDFRASLGNTVDRTTVSLPRAVWWNYHAYQEMTGRMVRATTDDVATVDLLAAVDPGLHRSVVLVGNQTSAPQEVELTLDDLPGELLRTRAVHVRVTMMPTLETLTVPPVLSEADLTVRGRSLQVRLPLAADAGYRIDVTPGRERAARTRLEAEDLPTLATPGVVYRSYEEEGASGGVATALEATEDGQWVRYTVPVDRAGVFELCAGLKSLGNRGIAQVYLDGEALGGPLDEYGGQGYHSVVVGVAELTVGSHEVEFRVVAKYPTASARTFVVDYLELVELASR